ncbi:TetR/AcrR family transcriptional regulator [Mycobacterium montefiorense]|uniref:TetR/AcrR family transcriptional regulator n=1 Tax=Mycobacterium montefiorense TaxID=154654 RepID=UPI0019125FE9|nr:TetR/AcrR family transcriptional regulator [Mycobacterium montefiorense]
MDGAGAIVESGTRVRTRRAILDAAVSALTRNPQAALADIALVANVGRSTVHRYFPERSDLLAAIGTDATEKIAAATVRARLGDGSAPDALTRLAQEYFELGDLLLLVINRPDMFDIVDWVTDTDADRALILTIERGHVEGTVDTKLDPAWIQYLLWGLLISSWELTRLTRAPKHHVLGQCIYTLTKAITP